jgi:hypothetical protein
MAKVQVVFKSVIDFHFNRKVSVAFKSASVVFVLMCLVDRS